LRKGRSEAKSITLEPLARERAEPVTYMASAIRNKKDLEGLTALDINVGVVEIIEAAKQSVKTGRAVPLPLKQ
jgi:scyllo-inositol 2-dehydrogenase (NADP+)